MAVVVTVGLAVRVTLVLLLVHHAVIVIVVVAISHVALIVLPTLAILKLVQHTTHLQQAHPLLGLAHSSAVQTRCRVESAVGVPIALGVSLERRQPVRLGIGGHLCHVVVARDGELGGLGAVRVGQRAELGAVAAGHEVLGNHVSALGGGVDGDGGGPVDAADPAHGSGVGVRGVEVHVRNEAGEGGAAISGPLVYTCEFEYQHKGVFLRQLSKFTELVVTVVHHAAHLLTVLVVVVLVVLAPLEMRLELTIIHRLHDLSALLHIVVLDVVLAILTVRDDGSVAIATTAVAEIHTGVGGHALNINNLADLAVLLTDIKSHSWPDGKSLVRSCLHL